LELPKNFIVGNTTDENRITVFFEIIKQFALLQIKAEYKCRARFSYFGRELRS